MKVKFPLLTSLLVITLIFSACSPIDSISESEPKSSLPPPDPTNTFIPTFEPTDLPTLTHVPKEIPTALPEGVELVNLKTPDSINLVGYLHKPVSPLNDKLIVILAHGHTTSHVEWTNFEEILVENGITTMTVDFRGHGSSGGIDRFSTIGIDVQTVLNYLEQNGYKR